MNSAKSLEYLTGFFMGIFMGFGLTLALLFVYNLLARWFGWPAMPLTWWNALPLTLWLGIVMSINITRLNLGDY